MKASLVSPEQIAAEVFVAKALAVDSVRKRVEASAERLRAARPDQDIKRAPEQAVEEFTAAFAYEQAVNDPSNPQLLWLYTPPRRWLGHVAPGSRVGTDNVDNVYRAAVIDDVSKYELSVRPISDEVESNGFVMVLDREGVAYTGEQKPDRWLVLQNPVRDVDGSFKISIGPEPGSGRKNYVQTQPGIKWMLIRETLTDWGQQMPMRMTLRRVVGPALSKRPSFDESVKFVCDGIDHAEKLLLSYEQWYPMHESQFTFLLRTGGFGAFASAGFKLADDEALVVSVDRRDADYLGFQVTSPWHISLNPAYTFSSLNNAQAHPGKDGTYTYVIAGRDPGAYNWLDTSGLPQGGIAIRWQDAPSSSLLDESAIKLVKTLKLKNLRDILPVDTHWVTPQEREQMLEKRTVSFNRRSGVPCVTLETLSGE